MKNHNTLFLIASIVLASCSAITGSHPYQNVRVDVPADVVIRDVHTGKTIDVDTVKIDDTTQRVIRLRNGRRHALAFTSDSGVAYQTTDLKRNGWGILNVFNWGFGCLLDQIAETNYFIKPDTLRKLNFQMLNEERQRFIEDSLRNIERYPIPHSLIDKRTNFVASLWVSTCFAGSQASDLAFLNGYGYGVGIAPIPYVMVFYDFNSIKTGFYPDDLVSDSSVIHQENFSRTLGIALQEPRLGIFMSYRYGTGVIDSEGALDGIPTIHSTDITTYSFSFGFYGQVGRMEYRQTRITSFSNPTTLFETPTVVHGIYWTLSFML